MTIHNARGHLFQWCVISTNELHNFLITADTHCLEGNCNRNVLKILKKLAWPYVKISMFRLCSGWDINYHITNLLTNYIVLDHFNNTNGDIKQLTSDKALCLNTYFPFLTMTLVLVFFSCVELVTWHWIAPLNSSTIMRFLDNCSWINITFSWPVSYS